MPKKLILVILIPFFAVTSSFSTHIVGGEFELIHINGFNYKLRMIQYFDVINGNPGAQDNNIIVSIFRLSNNEQVRTVLLQLVNQSLVEYTQPQCAIGQLVTRKLEYEADIFLSPDVYNEPEGYHVVFERCCRNNVIDNLFQPAPNTVGQTWTLDFPPVVKDGLQFINSSPVLFPPLSDYACDGHLYFFDFAGSDPDGDSIAYSLTTPLTSSSTLAFPINKPKPHTEATWAPGIDIDNVIPGDIPLNTTVDGFLTVNPSTPGLYVFALLAEEFRDGEKIGQVRRDFQMLVIDCPNPYSPEIAVRKKNATEDHDLSTVLSFTQAEEKCFNLIVTDENSTLLGEDETINISFKPLNFGADISDIIAQPNGVILANQDSVVFEVCLPDCPYIEGPFEIEFIASDGTCPLPLTDTVELAIEIEAPPNTDPFYTDAGMLPLTNKFFSVNLQEGDVYEQVLFGRDNDNDSLEIRIFPDGFALEDFGMVVTDSISEAGRIVSKFSWDTGCGVNDYGLFSDFRINMVLDDLDECMFGSPDTLKLFLQVELPPNTNPMVSASLGQTPVVMSPTRRDIDIDVDVFSDVAFTVSVDDADNDYVFLSGLEGEGFTMADKGMNWQDNEGSPVVTSDFSWSVACEVVERFQDNIYTVYFVGLDSDRCKIPNADTLAVNFKVIPPANEAPELSIVGRTEHSLTVRPGTLISEEVLGIDADNDLLNLELVNFSDRLNLGDFEFNNATGTGQVQSTFSWLPPCDLDRDSVVDEFQFEFLLTDDYCVWPAGDTLVLEIILEDPVPDYNNFTPPNVFTPNGDQKNDLYRLTGDPDLEPHEILPDNTCEVQFERIRIFNRWGKQVFSSTLRDFVWDGDGDAAGVYYYHIEYGSNVDYKGTISILR